MTKYIEAVKQADGLWTIKTVETNVVWTGKDILPPPVVIPPVVIPPAPTYLFHDDFSSLGLTTATNGISWGAGNFGSGDKKPVVTMECPYKGKPSLKFTFGGGIPEDDAWSEQRIKLPSMPEFWIQFVRYCPNGLESPSVGPKWFHRDAPGSDNNKFQLFWGGNYQGYSIMAGIAAWENDLGYDVMYPMYGSNQGIVSGQHGLPSAPAHNDSMLGRWVKVTAHYKCATAANNDGVIQMWEDDVLKIDSRKIPLYPKDGIGNFFTEGYLFGWSNTGFDKTTHCYIAEVDISDKPI